MSTGLVIWLVLSTTVTLVWLSRHVEVSRVLRDQRPLSPDSYGPIAADAPRVSILVAAKDEEANIETCVRTLLEQDYPDFEVIAANDRSRDRTGAILDNLARQYPDRLTVVHVESLPEGWFGKNHAMRQGVARATGEWLLFVDADCRQVSRRSLAVAMQDAVARGVAFISVMPVLETRSFWERVIQPVCGAVMALWFNPRNVNDPTHSAAYANGAFMLMTRANYDAIGGHDAVRTELNEDIQMARLTKRLGRGLYVARNDGLYVTRMYASLGEAWRGWSRIFFGSFRSFRRLLISIIVLVVMSIMPFAALIGCAVGWLLSDQESERLWMPALVSAAVLVLTLESVIYRLMKMLQTPRWTWITYPLGAVLALGMLTSAMTKYAGAATTWRGTTYRGDARTDPVEPAAKPTAKPPARPATDVA